MSILNLHYPRPVPKPDAVLVIALAGATGSGKSTFSKWAASRCSDGRVISFADPLRESAQAAGWIPERKHEPEKRAFIQRHSQEQKEKYGEDMYARAVMERIGNDARPGSTYFIDDLRHFVEIETLLASESQDLTVFPIHFYNYEAEARWLAASLKHAINASDETKWSHHRSELEWRSYRHGLQQFKNTRASNHDSEEEIRDSLSSSQEAFARFLRRSCDHYYDAEFQQARRRVESQSAEKVSVIFAN